MKAQGGIESVFLLLTGCGACRNVLHGVETFFRSLCCLLVAIALLTACDKGSDGVRRTDTPDPPGSGEGPVGRPDPEQGWDFTAEIADGCLRFEGSEMRLRIDRGGVLFKTLPDGHGAVIDLDSGRRVEYFIGEAGSDSVCRQSWVSIDGQKLEGATVRMKKQTAGTVWGHVEVARPQKGYMLVGLR